MTGVILPIQFRRTRRSVSPAPPLLFNPKCLPDLDIQSSWPYLSAFSTGSAGGGVSDTFFKTVDAWNKQANDERDLLSKHGEWLSKFRAEIEVRMLTDSLVIHQIGTPDQMIELGLPLVTEFQVQSGD
jgi:hypothetical protein